MTNITPEPNWSDILDDADFEVFKQHVSERLYRTKEEPGFWNYVRSDENVDDCIQALNEIRMEQEEVARGKKAAGNPTWPLTRLYSFEAERRLQGIKNLRHEREVKGLRIQVKNLQARIDNYESAA